MFGSDRKHTKEDPWLHLIRMEQLDQIESASFTKPQIIFKHSTRCSISSMAKNRMEDGMNELKEYADVYYLDLLRYRSISNEIESKWKVEHESPQVIILVDNQVVYHGSHQMIKVDEVKKHLK